MKDFIWHIIQYHIYLMQIPKRRQNTRNIELRKDFILVPSQQLHVFLHVCFI